MNQTEKSIEYKETAKRLKFIAAAAVLMLSAVLLVIVKITFASDQNISINSIEELQKIGRSADYPLDGQYLLTNDLDGSAVQEGLTIDQIGSIEQPFSGTFDGQGHVIKNLFIKAKEIKPSEENGSPLFFAAENSVVRLTLEQVVLKEETEDIIDPDEEPGTQATEEEVQKPDAGNKDGEKQEDTKAPPQSGTADLEPKADSGQNKKEPVKISTWEQFIHIGDTSYNSKYTMDADYILTDKIVSDGKKFTPIGTKDNPFTGTFDGQDYPIDLRQNPEIQTDSSYSGLFGVVKEPK